MTIGCEEKDLYNTRSEDDREMVVLKNEIDKIATQYSCDNATEWKFVSIGAKACGGASGYIAYSSKVDEATLLSKIEIYTQKQNAYNIKWSVISDCSLVMQPKSVECVSGKPKLVY